VPRPGQAYERIGGGYSVRRQPEPTWEQAILAALGSARTVVNVGAGAGSYEPLDRPVVAVEPSAVMLAQRPQGSAPAVRAVAERLPLGNASFDAALAVLTLHHWSDPVAGLAELTRVSGRVVVVTWDQRVVAESFWFMRDYLPEVIELEAHYAALELTTYVLGPTCEVLPLPVPADCRDGFFAAYWRRPEAYLDQQVRAAISALALLPHAVVHRAVNALAADLESGRWSERYADLLAQDELDLGYRLVVADVRR
jgi:SAM-dependent methyltransferase